MIGKRLQVAIKSKDVSILELSQILAISQDEIERFLSDGAMPNSKQLSDMVKYFGLSLNYFFGNKVKSYEFCHIKGNE